MNEKKTRLLRDGQRQEVTGLTVNSSVNVSRKYIKDLRWILHIWETEGYARAYSKFYPKYKKEKGYIKKGEPVMENVIGGKLNYLRMVRGDNNVAYLKLQARYDKLQQLVFVDNETDKGESYIYVQPYTIADFCNDFATRISLEVSTRKNLIGKCYLFGIEKIIAISKSTQKMLCPDLDRKKTGDIISSESLVKCHVTLCRSKGKNFWLITEFLPHRSKCLSIQNAKVDIDELLEIWDKQGVEAAIKAFTESFVVDGVNLKTTVEPKDAPGSKSTNAVVHVSGINPTDIDRLLAIADQVEQELQNFTVGSISDVDWEELNMENDVEDVDLHDLNDIDKDNPIVSI